MELEVSPKPNSDEIEVRGEIVDLDGEDVSAAVVILSSPDVTLRANSSFEGQFRFGDVPPGLYKLSANHAEYGRIELSEISVEAGSEYFLTLTLAPD